MGPLMPMDDVAYLDAGPLVSLVLKEDRFHDQTVHFLSEFQGIKVTSLLACLESTMVLRRTHAKKTGSYPNATDTFAIWNSIVEGSAVYGIELYPAPRTNPFEESQAREILERIAMSPWLPDERGSWIRSVGILDCIHLKAAESLAATIFVTTDRCLAGIASDIGMVLISDRTEWRVELVPPRYLMRGERTDAFSIVD